VGIAARSASLAKSAGVSRDSRGSLREHHGNPANGGPLCCCIIRLRTTGTNFLLSVMFAFFAYAAFLDWQRNGASRRLFW
jgi:hypothetical protein